MKSSNMGYAVLAIFVHTCGKIQNHSSFSLKTFYLKLFTIVFYLGTSLVSLGQDNGSGSDNFMSSPLPIFIIETEAEIPDDPKITAKLMVIYNPEGPLNYLTDEPNHYNGWIGIELRGNSTQRFPKKPYSIETRDVSGNDLNFELLGLPAESDWILRASYLDHTFIRNPLAMYMSRLMGRWASRTRHVEVILNGEYVGIYILMERLKRDKHRVAVAKLNYDEIEEPDITGGYIFEITGFEDNLGWARLLKYPKYAEAHPLQIKYITDYDNAFRKRMEDYDYKDPKTGYAQWIDVPSFVDEMLVQEAMRNSDAYGWSGYFHKDKEAKLAAGPLWDFDQSAGNSSYPDDAVVGGWMFQHPGTNNTPFFWKKLWDDPMFFNRVKERWRSLRETDFKTENLVNYVDSIAQRLQTPANREFKKWPVLGKDIWRETSGYRQRVTYQKEVDFLKDFLTARWKWMDQRFEYAQSQEPNNHQIKIYPNPFAEVFSIDIIKTSSQDPLEFSLFDSLGRLVKRFVTTYTDSGQSIVDVQNLQSGIYFFQAKIGKDWMQAGKLVKL